jgi:hypothetical protein
LAGSSKFGLPLRRRACGRLSGDAGDDIVDRLRRSRRLPLQFLGALLMRRKRIEKPKVIVRPLDPDDPRNLNHPSHREQWLELARAIGWMEARDEIKHRAGHGKNDGAVRSVFERHAKEALD